MLSILVVGNNSTEEYARRIFSGLSCDIRFILVPPDQDPVQFMSTGAYDLVLSEYPPGQPELKHNGIIQGAEEPLPALVIWPVNATTARAPAEKTVSEVKKVPGTPRKTRDLFTQLGSRITQVLEKSEGTEEAKKTQSRLCNILASINTGVFIVDMTKKAILHVNEYALQRMQVPKENVIGKDYHEYLEITGQTNHFEALPEEGVLQSEGIIRGKDGLTVPVILNVTPARLSSGTHMLITFLDNSSQKQAEKALRESETTYGRLVETSPDAIILTDTRGNILRANSNAHVFFGFENEDEIRGKMLSDLFHPVYPAPKESFTGRVMLEGVVREEMTGISRSGHHFPVEISSSVIHDTEGTPYSLIHIIRDIFDRKMAEEALRASEERYRNIVEDQNELICRFKPDGTHVFVNDAYCRYFGMKKEDITGSRFIPGIHPDDRKALHIHFASLTRENPVALIDHRLIMPDGSIRWQRWSDRAIFDDSGNLVEYQSVGRDITERKEIEAALLASEERYRNIIEDQTEFICRFKPDGTHVFVNGAYCRYFCMKKEKIIGTRFIPDIHPGDREALRKHFASLTPENPVALIDHRIIMPDGSVRWQRWSDRAIFDGTGNLVEYQSVGRDITLLKDERRGQ